MSDPIAERDAELATTLEELDQADEQFTAWRDERERLARKAKALGATHRVIAEHMSMTHPGVGKLIARGAAAWQSSTDVG